MAKNLVLAKAQNAVLAHDWVTAARLYKELLRGNESNVDYLKELGSIYVKAGEDEKAIPYYEQIITFYPHYIDAMNSLGAIYRRLKRYDESISILQRALDEGRNIPAVKYNLGFTYKEMGNYDDAIDAFEAVIANNPDDVLAYNHLGSIYFAQKAFDKSIASFRRGLQVDPNHPILNYNLARCFEADKNFTDAVRHYEICLRTRPGWPDAIRDFSGLLIKCQENKKAQDLVEKSIKLHPTDADLLCILGRIFLNQFDYDNASKTYTKADALKGNDVKILTSLSEALEKGEKIDKALEKAIEAVEIDPYNKDAKKQYVHSLLSAQRYDQAYENVVALKEETEEKDPQVLDLCAQYYICRGDETNAKEYHSKIQKLNHHYKDYMLSASDRYAQIGNLDKAEEYAKQYVERRSQMPEGYNRLGAIAAAKGDYKTAKLQYEKGSQLTHPNVLATKGLERVNAELARHPDLMNYETPPIEVDAEKENIETEQYVPQSFIGEVVGAENTEETAANEEAEFDYGQLGDNVPMGEALLEDEEDFWGEFDDDPNAEPQPPAEEEEKESEEEQPEAVQAPGSPFGDDLLDSLAQSGGNSDKSLDDIEEDTENLSDIAGSLADDEGDFDFGDFEDAEPGEEIQDAESAAPVEEPETVPPAMNTPEYAPEPAPEPVPQPQAPAPQPQVPPQPQYQPPQMPYQPAYDPMFDRQMQASAYNSAGSAIEAAVMAQKMAQQVSEQQRQFEKELTEKNEQMIKDSVDKAVDKAVEKAVEQKMQKSMDDQMERIMGVEESEFVPEEKPQNDIPEDDFKLPSENEETEVEVEPIESIMNPEEEPVHEEMDEFLSNDEEEGFGDVSDFASDEETEAPLEDEDFADVADFASEDEADNQPEAEETADEEAEEDFAFAEVAEFASDDDEEEEVPEEPAETEPEEDFDFSIVTDYAGEAVNCEPETEAEPEEEENFAEVSEFAGDEDTTEETVEGEPAAEEEEDFADVVDFAGDTETVEEEPVTEEEENFGDVTDFTDEEPVLSDIEEDTPAVEEEEPAVEQEEEPAETEQVEETPESEEPAEEAPAEEAPAAKLSLEEELAKIEKELSNPEAAVENAEQIELFKTLRVLSNFLPANEKDSFLSCRIRMIIEYIIAKMSGKPGLLITAESLLKSGVLGEEYEKQLTTESEEELSNELIRHVLKYMKSLAENLEDPQLAKALCLSADNILEQIELRNQSSEIF